MNPIVTELIASFNEAKVHVPEMLWDESGADAKYNEARQVFNRRFQFMPVVIVYCTIAQQVSVVVKFIGDKGLQLRVRSGGHDHEGECSATDVVLIDLSGMTGIETANGVAYIGAGNRFIRLTSELAKRDVMIPHGTCQTVAVSGFTMGGGWGPWTRKYGMCCERVVGATIVLGDGSIVKLRTADFNDDDPARVIDDKGLLWAIKGGGGFSYGIVTEFIIRTFELPPVIIKFQYEWNRIDSEQKLQKLKVRRPVEHLASIRLAPKRLAAKTGKKRKAGGDSVRLAMSTEVPTRFILAAWEKMIFTVNKDTDHLTGTNIKVLANPEGTGVVNGEAYHNCTMYGYWEGTEKELEAFLLQWFGKLSGELKILGYGGRDYPPKEPKGRLKSLYEQGTKYGYGNEISIGWDRFSYYNLLQRAAGYEGTPYPPDRDDPAPHKITSRLVNGTGLGEAGRKALIESLVSPLLSKENLDLGLFCYITLGAFTGRYYQEPWMPGAGGSSFPYADKAYTIQYQTWWNTTDEQKALKSNNDVYRHVNRALDWMEVCRDYVIPNTTGAFISFKDASVTTAKYFAQNYNKLIDVKETAVRDPFNHFSSRKTIL